MIGGFKPYNNVGGFRVEVLKAWLKGCRAERLIESYCGRAAA